MNNRVLLKREDLQPVFSFKIRGAYNRIANSQRSRERARGIITASAGNHAQGVAFSGQKLGIDTTIVMPVTTPAIKVAAVRAFGVKVVLFGDNYSEAAEHCASLVSQSGMVFIPPFDDELVIAGQGTVADELLRQSAGRIDAVFVPVGGGGLLAGVSLFLKELCPDIRVIGVEPVDSDAMARSLAAGHRVKLDSVGIFADGVAVREVGKLTFDICRQHVDEIILVDVDEICSAVKSVYQATRSIVEPAGALATAGLKKYVRERKVTGQSLVAINSGANMNFDRLRYVAERTLIGEKQEALFAVTIPEEPGALFRFCREVVGDRNITEFNYRLSGRESAYIFVGIAIDGDEQRKFFRKQLTEHGFENIDLTDNELAKTHVRYMVGGRSQMSPENGCSVSGSPNGPERWPVFSQQWALTGTSRCSTTAFRVVISAESWSAWRFRKGRSHSCRPFLKTSVTDMSKRLTTRPISFSCNSQTRRNVSSLRPFSVSLFYLISSS